jgi:glycosyltransferase involved in cell wall biosynthesis
MPKSEPLVSVVTPVYNGERFLRGCIESVLAQTYSNWDYTIVNNCSTDRTLEIAQEYAAKDPRIKPVVTNKAFVRVIENHNNAFREISPESKYCKVVAADDQLMPECLEKMVRLAEEHPTVGLVGAYGLAGNRVIWQGLRYPTAFLHGRELAHDCLMGTHAYVFGTPTSVMYRSDIVRSKPAFYNESNIHADTEICLEIMAKHDFGFVHQVLTTQDVRDDSLTSFSRRINTYLASVLFDLKQYGPTFLSEEELKIRLREHIHYYYWYLAKEVFKRRDKEFWDFHRAKLAAFGYPLSRARLARYVVWVSLDLFFDPKTSTGKPIRHKWQKGRARPDIRYRVEYQS